VAFVRPPFLDRVVPDPLANVSVGDPLASALAAVEFRSPSFISDHGTDCCRSARAWFHCLAKAALARGASPPVWIRERWDWGAQDWPLYWCRIPAATSLDCGALASLARFAFEIAGAAALPVQLLEQFDADAVAHWQATWAGRRSTGLWTWDFVAYHEAVAIAETSQRIRIWDPTDSHFIEPASRSGYATILALRLAKNAAILSGSEGLDEVFWNGVRCRLNRWTRIPHGGKPDAGASHSRSAFPEP